MSAGATEVRLLGEYFGGEIGGMSGPLVMSVLLDSDGKSGEPGGVGEWIVSRPFPFSFSFGVSGGDFVVGPFVSGDETCWFSMGREEK